MKRITIEWLAGMVSEALIARGVETDRETEAADIEEWINEIKADVWDEGAAYVNSPFGIEDGMNNPYRTEFKFGED